MDYAPMAVCLSVFDFAGKILCRKMDSLYKSDFSIMSASTTGFKVSGFWKSMTLAF